MELINGTKVLYKIVYFFRLPRKYIEVLKYFLIVKFYVLFSMFLQNKNIKTHV